MIFLAIAGAAMVVWVLVAHHWYELNSKDMGTMSRRWLAEYNAQHP